MSLQAQGLEPIAEATRRLAQKSSPKGTAIMRLRDALGPIYQDESFAELFPRRGRPAEARLSLSAGDDLPSDGESHRSPSRPDGGTAHGLEIRLKPGTRG